MKTMNKMFGLLLVATLILSSCEKDNFPIYGSGPVVTKSLQLDDFTGINLVGVDDVFISYGSELSVLAEGHENIIDRIKTDVHNNTWDIELEEGNYRNYELTYYLVLPQLVKVSNTGTGNVVIEDFQKQESLSVSILGTGSFLGFPMEVNTCEIEITGTGNCEVTVDSLLEVSIDGTGNVYYKGNPQVDADIVGTGSVSPASK